VEVLGVGVDRNKLDPVHFGGDHVIQGIFARPPNAYHADPSERLNFRLNALRHIVPLSYQTRRESKP
jgi:hypothetical protein